MENNSDKVIIPADNSLRERIWRVIFLSDSGAAKLFDVILLILIAGSVLVVMLETVNSIQVVHGKRLRMLEWIFTILFSIEYAVRMSVVRKKRRYAFSFFGIVDLLSILPTWNFLWPGRGILSLFVFFDYSGCSAFLKWHNIWETPIS